MRKVTRRERQVAPIPTLDSQATDHRRRRFLATLGVGGVGAAVAAAGALPGVAAAQVATPQATDEGSAYRETAHVRDYYRTAKI